MLRRRIEEQARSSSSSVGGLIAALKAASGNRDLEAGRAAHRAAVASGQHSNIYVATTLVSMYAKCGSLIDARAVFQSIEQPNVVSWNALLLGFVDNSQWLQALDTFRQIAQPNARSFCAALCACTGLAGEEQSEVLVRGLPVKLGSLRRGMTLHSAAAAAGCIDSFTATALINMYAKCGSLDDAHRAFLQMPRKDTASWNALLLGYASSPSPRHAAAALDLFDQLMLNRQQPDARTFVAPIMACATLAMNEGGRMIEGRAVKAESLSKGRLYHAQAQQWRLCDMFVCNTLIDMYSKCGGMADAVAVFRRMPARDVAAWTAMITGLADNGLPQQALRCFRRSDTPPNARTLVAALSAAEQVGDVERGRRELHAAVCRAGWEECRAVANSLVDFYGKCGGCMTRAELVFCSAPERDVAMWNSLLGGFGRRGETRRVFEVAAELREGGMQPDGATYVLLLAACSHAGLVAKGRAVFAAIEQPGAEHWQCMVDLLCRGNRLEEAVQLVKSMPRGPTVVAWKTLLGACCGTGNIAVARFAFESLLALDQDLGTAYVLMANVYGAAGMLQQRDEMLQLQSSSDAVACSDKVGEASELAKVAEDEDDEF